MRYDVPAGDAAYYEPSNFDGPKDDSTFREPPLKISGNADRYNHRDGNDDYTQAGNLFRMFDDGQKRRLYANIAAAMGGAPRDILDRQLEHFAKADPEYAEGIRNVLDGVVKLATA